jgi:hypothetical protein
MVVSYNLMTRIIKGKFRESADASQNYLILGKKFY